MLAPSFRKRVKIVPEERIGSYLAPGYEQFLPDDMQTGLADTDAMIEDFLAFRRFVERNAALELDEPHATSDVMSVASGFSHQGSDVPMPNSMEDQTMTGRSFSSKQSSSFNGSLSRFSNSDYSTAHSDDMDDDASIHCDISNHDLLESEDMKQPATTLDDERPLYELDQTGE